MSKNEQIKVSELTDDCFLQVEDLKQGKSESKIRKSMEYQSDTREEEDDDDEDDDDEGDEIEEQTEEQEKVLEELKKEIRDSQD